MIEYCKAKACCAHGESKKNQAHDACDTRSEAQKKNHQKDGRANRLDGSCNALGFRCAQIICGCAGPEGFSLPWRTEKRVTKTELRS